MKKIKIITVFFLIFFLAGAAFFVAVSRAQEGMPSLKVQVSYGSENLRDPFKSPIQSEDLNQPGTVAAGPEMPLPALKVQGVFWGASFPQVIINDKIAKVGDTIDGVKILSISKDIIEVFFGSRQYKISTPASDNSASSSQQGKKEAIP